MPGTPHLLLQLRGQASCGQYVAAQVSQQRRPAAAVVHKLQGEGCLWGRGGGREGEGRGPHGERGGGQAVMEGRGPPGAQNGGRGSDGGGEREGAINPCRRPHPLPTSPSSATVATSRASRSPAAAPRTSPATHAPPAKCSIANRRNPGTTSGPAGAAGGVVADAATAAAEACCCPGGEVGPDPPPGGSCCAAPPRGAAAAAAAAAPPPHQSETSRARICA